jgi:hypothetical protein
MLMTRGVIPMETSPKQCPWTPTALTLPSHKKLPTTLQDNQLKATTNTKGPHSILHNLTTTIKDLRIFNLNLTMVK